MNKQLLQKIGLVLLGGGLCPLHSMTPVQALDLYLLRSHDGQPQCTAQVFGVEIDASLPKLRKQGSMSGLKIVSQTGRIIYRGLRFTGDNIVKTAVIARFLANDTDPPERYPAIGVTRENYLFSYEKTSDYNGLVAYVFRVRPRRRQEQLFKGELWLDAATAAPLRVWGDLVKAPSLFVSSFRFVQDYQNVDRCVQPLRLLVSVQTRLTGPAEMTVWLHPVAGLKDAATPVQGH